MPAKPALDLWDDLAGRICSCRRCPRLRAHCNEVARVRRRAYADEAYWGRPVPGFGDRRARIWIIGLAPAAHGANRTGRMFTGDRSGDFLYAALHRAGLASQPQSIHRDDGMRLSGVYISAAARCAPPANKPLPGELVKCSGYLDQEFALLTRKRVMLCLGAIAWRAAVELLRRQEQIAPGGIPAFGHATVVKAGSLFLLGSYHVSQQNTFTGRLTPAMFGSVLSKAVRLAEAGG